MACWEEDSIWINLEVNIKVFKYECSTERRQERLRETEEYRKGDRGVGTECTFKGLVKYVLGFGLYPKGKHESLKHFQMSRA